MLSEVQGLLSFRRGRLKVLPLTFLLFIFYFFTVTLSSVTQSEANTQAEETAKGEKKACLTCPQEPADVASFRLSVGGSIKPVIVELKDEPGVLRKYSLERKGLKMPIKDLVAYSLELRNKQNLLLSSLPGRGVRALIRQSDVRQIDGSIRHIEYRFHYLLNGFVVYVAEEDLDRLRAIPEIKNVHEVRPVNFLLDKAIDYSLGTQSSPADRRSAVYGPTQEFTPSATPGHPEAPSTVRKDGFEGQNIIIAVIDTGIDWRHPMFGGIGQSTPLPRVSGAPESANDNKKVIYYYALSSPGDPTDDFGHGTFVSSCAAGYAVDGNTVPRPGYGLGRDNQGVGPTPNNAQLFGMAPQARLMAYKVCGPATQCLGDSELAMEDAASPFTLLSSGTPTPVSKPVADVINLSLGDTAGDPSGISSRMANNAALAGTIVVASAGNAGPGPGTIGAPSAATLAISVAASLDPGSTAVSDVLAPSQIPGEPGSAGSEGPAPETGDVSLQNAAKSGERQAMTLFLCAGGGPIPGGSLSAHYVFVDRRPADATIPPEVKNRIAVVKGSGTFAQMANAVAPFGPAGILIVTDIESATAVAVLNGIPTFTISESNGNYLIDRMKDGDPGDGDNNVDVPMGTISQFPLRLGESATFETFRPSMAGFSSRGPNDHANARFRTIKPDVTAPGVGITAAATVEGIPDDTVGMASLTGYTTANGTSFSGPITAGAMALIRQRVREELKLDTTNLADPAYRTKRFDTVTVARALLMNSATNLRSAFGVAEQNGAASTASINEMGAGHINVAGALQAKAIMVAPTFLLSDPEEYTPPAGTTPDSQGRLSVLIPSASFGEVPVVGVTSPAPVVRMQEVIIRDVTNGGGSGTYTLTSQDNRSSSLPGVQISFRSAANKAVSITTINVPAGGQTSFFVSISLDGTKLSVDPTELQWYVTATKTGQNPLRMPFYLRAVRPLIPNITAPVQQQLGGTEEPSTTGCAVDVDGNYRVRWTYTMPEGPTPVGFRVQEGSRTEDKFFDNADTLLVAGANATWAGSEQWLSLINPDSGSIAYFIPDVNDQSEALEMVNPIALPAGGATLSFKTNQNLEDGFDIVNVEVVADGVGFVVASYGNDFVGTRTIDISPFAGKSIKLRFRMVSDTLNGEACIGWWVEDIRITSDDFKAIAETGPGSTFLDLTNKSNGRYLYRVAGLFSTSEGKAAGPYSNTNCVTVARTVSATKPDLQVSSASATQGQGSKLNITATITNLGTGNAVASKTELLLDDTTVLKLADTPQLGPNGSATVSYEWDTSSVKGTHTIKITADKTNVADELIETNNSSSLIVVVQGNKVQNSSFEQANSGGTGPESWSGSNTGAGTTSWSNGGSDGAKSVSITGNGGNALLAGSPSWVSAPIPVTAGQSLNLAASIRSTGASSAATVGLVYLGSAGQVLNTATMIAAPLTTSGFTKLEKLVTIPAGVAQVRVKLAGFTPSDLSTAGTVTFDDIGLFEIQ
jgi:hypothetical protein